MDFVQKLMQQDMEKLDQVIRTDLSSNVLLINQISNYIITSGGKRIRPLLTLLCGRVAGFTDGDLLHKMAAMIEYIHTATLLHDDVVDESGLRRGRKTANAVFGNAASVLVGDFIYTRSFQMMVQSDSIELLSVMANCTNKVSEGEVLQLLNIGKEDLTEDEYFKVIESKTAALFEAAARVAAIITKIDSTQTEALAKYAVNLGVSFQITDDILDYAGSSDSIGKNVGDDLTEGKVTLPLIYLLHNSNDSVARDLIKHAINNPDQAKLDQVIQEITNSQALDYCKSKANYFANQAISSLDVFADSQYKGAMVDLAQFTVDRLS